MKVVLTKDKCLAVIGEMPTEVTDDSKWDELDENVIANLHLELADGVIINLTSNVLVDYLVFDDVAAAILEEENRRNNRKDKQTSSRQVEALVVMKGRKDCRGLNTSNPQGNVACTSKDGNALCCEAAVSNESRKIFADVCCNDHKLKIIGIGSIMVNMHDGTIRTIRDVRHVEGLKKNLLSLGQFDDLGCRVEIQNKIMKIIKGVLVLMRGEKVAANLYQLKGEIIVEAPVLSLGGARYFVSFIDDYSRRCWVYLIKKKSDVFEVFKVYKARVELNSRKKIKCLRTYNGGEYTGDEFDTFCKQKRNQKAFHNGIHSSTE
ncbi:gag-pol polyprotein [Tanacetum coccineum]